MSGGTGPRNRPVSTAAPGGAAAVLIIAVATRLTSHPTQEPKILTCKRNHTYRGDENYRARSGYCPVCFREVQARYDRTEKGRERQTAYNHSEAGLDRAHRYRQSPKGWMNDMNLRRSKALVRIANRRET